VAALTFISPLTGSIRPSAATAETDRSSLDEATAGLVSLPPANSNDTMPAPAAKITARSARVPSFSRLKSTDVSSLSQSELKDLRSSHYLRQRRRCAYSYQNRTLAA